MGNFIKVKIKKNINSKDEYNDVLVNLNNIVKVERISNKIEFLPTDNTMRSIIGVYETSEEAEKSFDEIWFS
tara:strand:+ start:693 stop:908 length:216 start_codon:yes stop_codon:yes gene_type:complete